MSRVRLAHENWLTRSRRPGIFIYAENSKVIYEYNSIKSTFSSHFPHSLQSSFFFWFLIFVSFSS